MPRPMMSQTCDAFYLAANPHAARAKDAAVVVEHVPLLREVHRQRGVAIGEAHAGDAERDGQRLKFAVAVGDAHRAEVIALGQQQLDDHAAVGRQPRRVDHHRKAFLHRRGAGGRQPPAAAHFDDAQAAGAHIRQAVQMAQGGDGAAGFARRFENGLAFARGDQLTFDSNRDCFGFLYHARYPFTSHRRQRHASSRA